jgi:hypothetical protein
MRLDRIWGMAKSSRSRARQVSLPKSTPVPVPQTTHHDRLEAASVAVDVAEARVRAEVIAARRAGITWTAIARALDVTPQAVQQRFGRLTDRP